MPRRSSTRRFLTGPRRRADHRGRQLQSRARARLLDGRYSRTSSSRRRSGICRSATDRRSSPGGVRRRAGQRLDADGRADAAVRAPDCRHAGDQQQRVRRASAPSGPTSLAIRPCRRRAVGQRAGSTPAPSRPRRSSRWAAPPAIRSAAPAIAISISRSCAACRLQGTNALELRAEVFNVTNTPPLGNPNGVFGSAASGHHHGGRPARRAVGGEVVVLGAPGSGLRSDIVESTRFARGSSPVQVIGTVRQSLDQALQLPSDTPASSLQGLPLLAGHQVQLLDQRHQVVQLAKLGTPGAMLQDRVDSRESSCAHFLRRCCKR